MSYRAGGRAWPRGSFQVNATSNEPMDPSDVTVTEEENAHWSSSCGQSGRVPAGQGGSIT